MRWLQVAAVSVKRVPTYLLAIIPISLFLDSSSLDAVIIPVIDSILSF